MYQRYLLLVALFAGASSQASACSPAVFGPLADTSAYVKPMNVNPDCSFAHTYVVKEYGAKVLASVSGGAVRDLGNGRVAQRISSNGSCSYTEKLLFVECASAEMIAIEGITPNSDSEIAGFSEKRIDEIQKPKGPIRLGPKSSVKGLVEIAQANGFRFKHDLEAELAQLKKKNRFDPFCGCKLYYPDLAEASQ